MHTVTSCDGTEIAYDLTGDGPLAVIVGGAACDRDSFAELAGLLAPSFTVATYDRRGRGGSGDAATYEIAREVEDLAAVIGAAGGGARVFGHSSGGIIGLEAAAAGVSMVKLAAYEPPYVGRWTPGLIEEIRQLAASGHGDRALVAFLLETGMPEELVPMVKASPGWAEKAAIANTLCYDLTLMGDGTVPVERMARITVPTLVADGATSPDEMHRGALALVDAVPGAMHHRCEGQGHAVDQTVLAPLLAPFFA